MRRRRLYRSSHPAHLQPIIATAAALEEFAAHLLAQPRIALDTEFLRERTYRAQLCLVQLASPTQAACIDPLALSELGPLSQVLTAVAVPKVMHASRQDLEVLLPLGLTHPVFDTQIAAALCGLPAQIGYAEAVRRLLGRELPKAHTRTDWSRRPLSADQVRYALDDVNYLLALATRLQEQLAALGRLGWLEEELAVLADEANLRTDPQQAWTRLKGLRELDSGRVRLAQALAAWREEAAITHDRPRGWILDDAVLREIVLQVPRSLEALQAIPELPPGLLKRRGAELLALVEAAQIPAPPPPLPGRARPDPSRAALLKKLSGICHSVAGELQLAPEVLATRRELEALAEGARAGMLLQGWRRAVLGERLLAAL